MLHCSTDLPWWLKQYRICLHVGNLGWIPGQEDPLEKGMVTHSSILAWRIPRIEEPGWLHPWGRKGRKGQD